MHFTGIRLTQFRNYDSLVLNFGPGINCLTGNNGAGKTNVLEALHYLAMTRGFTGNTEKYSLKEGEPFFMIEGGLRQADRDHKIQCNYLPPKGKKMLVDGKPLRRMSSHIGRIPLLVVLPNDTQLIYGGPSLRRKFMDAFISQYESAYLQHLIAYEKALAQRNALLVQFAEHHTFDAEQLELWDLHLIPAGMHIHKSRKSFLEKYRPLFEKYFNLIVSDQEKPTIELDSPLEENTRKEWEAMFQTRRERDRHARRTTAGTHKEDLSFRIDGQPVKNFGSQGQQKTFVIALRLAQYEILHHEKQTPPILLLDDIFDKLDIHRLGSIARILHTTVQGQVFITDTTLERIQGVFAEMEERQIQYFRVDNAKIEKVEVHEESK